MARYLDVHPVDPQPRAIGQAAAVLRDGGLIAYPTDSGYALGAMVGVSGSIYAIRRDDFPDVPIMRQVGLPVAVGNAVPEVRQLAKVQLTREGGRGAVREFAELLLKARGEWDRTWNTYVDKRSNV